METNPFDKKIEDMEAGDFLHISFGGGTTPNCVFSQSFSGTVVQVTEKALKVQPTGAPAKMAIWLPKKAIIRKEFKLKGSDEIYSLNKLARWFEPNRFQSFVFSQYNHFSESASY